MKTGDQARAPGGHPGADPWDAPTRGGRVPGRCVQEGSVCRVLAIESSAQVSHTWGLTCGGDSPPRTRVFAIPKSTAAKASSRSW